MKVVKKILKFLAVVILLLVSALAVVPYFFKDEIIIKTKEIANNEINAIFNFEDIDLSLLSNFPNLSVSIKKVSVINKQPFEGDTLFYSGEISLKLSLSSLMKEDDEPYEIKSFLLKNSTVNILTTKEGIANYDIAKNTGKENKETKEDVSEKLETKDTTSPLKLQLQEYSIENLNLSYHDMAADMKIDLLGFNHFGRGDFTTSVFDLETKTASKITFTQSGTTYLNANDIALDAIFNIDLENNKYVFSKNSFSLNRLKLHFDGYIKILENGHEFDLTFNTPNSDFKSFLEMIPKSYSKDLEGITTRGNFSFEGQAKGIYNDKSIPTFNISMIADKAMFKYPTLPKAVEDITIKAKVSNTSGNIDDTVVDIHQFDFRIDEDKFHAKTIVTNVIKNPFIDAEFKGAINLENISRAYPITTEIPLKGSVKTNLSAKFDMESIEKEQYEKADIKGEATLSGVSSKLEGFPNPLNISVATISFTPNDVSMSNFKATSGGSDIQLKGSLKNLLGFLFKDEKIVATLSLYSNLFNTSDFISLEESSPEKTAEVAETTLDQSTKTKDHFEIPTFIESAFDLKINTLVYDQIKMKNITGKTLMKDGVLYLNHLNFNMLKGLVSLSGETSTKNKIATFKTNMKVTNMDIEDSFNTLNTFETIAPFGQTVKGKFSGDIRLSGNLDNELIPDTNSISGKFDIFLQETSFDPSKSETIKQLSKQLSFINLDKMNLDNVSLSLTVKDSRVTVAPFDVKTNDVTINVRGSHGFDQTMDYRLKSNLPAKYLGGDVTSLMKEVDMDANKTNIPLSVNITGNFKKPKFKINLKDAKEELKKKLIEKGKEKVKKEVKKEIVKQTEILIDKNLGKEGKEVKEKAKELLNGLFK